tara:strand:+ start:659 stop:1006 length:348 start_codon:yes stop_codon:yes gene_type:complete
MAFTYDITTDRGKVRLKLADTDSSAYVFEDDEIDYFLSSASTVDDGVVIGLHVLLADRARRAKSFSIQGLSLNDTAQIAAIQTLIEIYGGDEPTLAAVMPALMPSDAGFSEPIVG